MPVVRRSEHSRAGLGPSDLRRFFHCPCLRESDETRSGKNPARGEHRRRSLCSDASGASWRALALERGRVRERGPTRSLLRFTRTRGDDRTRANFRRANGFRKTTRRSVGQRWRKICEAAGCKQPERRYGGDDPQHQHQVLAGRIPQPERDRGGVISAQGDYRSCASKRNDDRKPRRVGRHHWERTGEMETGDA